MWDDETRQDTAVAGAVHDQEGRVGYLQYGKPCRFNGPLPLPLLLPPFFPFLLPTTATATQPLLFSSLLLLSPLPPSPLSLCPVSSASPPQRPSNARSSPLETHGMIDQTLPPE